jgi:hypothetical protein
MQDSKLIKKYIDLIVTFGMKSSYPSKAKINEVKWKHSTNFFIYKKTNINCGVVKKPTTMRLMIN